MAIKRNDIISSLYLLTIVFLTTIGAENNIFIMLLYFIFNFMLFNEIESILSVCVLTSTIAYYFVGADEGVFSIYTMLCIVIISYRVISKKMVVHSGTGASTLLKIALMIVATISYSLSKYEYFNGLVELIYIITVSIVVVGFCDIDYRKLIHYLGVHACLLILSYAIVFPFQYSYLAGRYSISPNVNFNTFGMSCAQLGLIILLDGLLVHNSRIQKRIRLFFFLISIILLYLSGSRTSLFALISAAAIVMTILANRNDRLSKKARNAVVAGIIILIFGIGLANFFGLDLSNYDYVVLLKGGGTNRFTIYQLIIPYIMAGGYYRIGYGPGHECSRIIVSQLVGRNYAHTHNLYIEAFGELGIGGLILTAAIIIDAIKICLKRTELETERFIPFGMLICLLINGLGESYFCDIVFWLLLAICTNPTWALGESQNEELGNE